MLYYFILTDNEYEKYNMNMEEHFMLNPHRINIYHKELNDNLPLID